MAEGEEGGYQIGKKMLFYIVFVVVLAVLFLGLYYIFKSRVQAPIETNPSVYSDVYLERLLGSPDCLAYKDRDTNNTFSITIDKSKFKNETLNLCLKPIPDSAYEFSFLLTDNDKATYIQTENFIVTSKQYSIPVLVYDKGNIRRAKLAIGLGGIS